MEQVDDDNKLVDAAAEVTTKKRKKKSKKRVRAHVNVFSPPKELPPLTPDHVEWKKIFPLWKPEESVVRVVDVGCGFGGLLEGLSPVWPEHSILGLEVRERVVDAVQDRLSKLCKKSASYGNLGVINMNAMKHLPNYFHKAQLTGMFFLYADPHFKKSKQKSRIISVDLLDVYAYVLAVGGRLYTCTDVEDLHNWEVEALEAHPSFVRLSEEECAKDPAVEVMLTSTDEAAKAKREGRGQWYSVYERIRQK
jgi:tRNA (guanine-N7-)-methyltransferase